MKNYTHFWFAFACVLVNNTQFNQFSLSEQLLLIPVALFVAITSFLPNILDKYACNYRKKKTCIIRCRHPVTHSPLTLFILVIALKLVTIGYSWSGFVIETFFIATGSHLFLDIFSEEGIPLGLKPTLFVQDYTKNYAFNDHTKPRMRLRFRTDRYFPNSRNTGQINSYISLGSKLIVLFLCLQVLWELYALGGIL